MFDFYCIYLCSRAPWETLPRAVWHGNAGFDAYTFVKFVSPPAGPLGQHVHRRTGTTEE